MTLQQLKYVVATAEKGTVSEAAQSLFISQPSLTNAIRELEKEMNITIFIRTNKGITVSKEGEVFLGYARQVLEQASLLEEKYCGKQHGKRQFCISTQHYSFAVNAFVDLIKEFGGDEYDFSIRETQTHEIIEDVARMKSELGILYLNDFNRKVLTKLFAESNLEFWPIQDCGIYVYLWKGHPLADKKEIALEELEDYPCLSFDQGTNNSFYFAEEVLSTYQYKRLVRANDRATMLNLMVGLNGYTLCSGILCEELNGEDYGAVRLKSDETMTIGYLKRKGIALSPLGQKYLEELRAVCHVSQ